MFHVEDSAAVVTILGWVEAVKGFVPDSLKKLLPLLAVGLGVAYAFGVKPNNNSGTVQTLILGVVLGLTAAGTYSAVKNGAEKMAAGKK